MFITKKHIPRRTFLRGAGVTLALPLLESMVPAQTPLRQTAASPGEALCRHLASARRGARVLESRCRKARTSSFRLSRNRWSRSAIATVLITGLDMPEAMATDDEPGGDHARGAALLSGARPRRNAVSPYLGVTIDQLIAKKYGQDTILSSIQLGVEDTGQLRQLQLGL